ncbi:MAG: hypothetical protein K9N51_02380 [Candidatus Pacebacteria bacterium]|nr:hypothetical protein [Candidatus Paceibacterota bacterium]
MSKRSDAMREREVMQKLMECRYVSTFWLTVPITRWQALNRLEKRGLISVKKRGYPMYRVTIHAGQDTVATGKSKLVFGNEKVEAPK